MLDEKERMTWNDNVNMEAQQKIYAVQYCVQYIKAKKTHDLKLHIAIDSTT